MDGIILAFARESARRQILRLLESEGLSASYSCGDGAGAIRAVRQQGGGVVICGFRLRDMTASVLARRLAGLAPLLVLAPAGDLALCEEGDGLCKLPIPVSPSDFHAALDLLCRRAASGAAGRNRRGGPDPSSIGKAKALLMDVHRMSEPEAHRFLQQYSMDMGLKLAQAAQAILDRYTK